MAISIAEAVERTFYRMSPGVSESEGKVYRFQIESWIPDALRRLGDSIADDYMNADRSLLTKTFPVTITSGVGPLDPAVNVRTIPRWGVITVATGTTDTTFPLQYLPHLQDLDLPRSLEFEYYTIHGGTALASIFIRKGDGTATSIATVSLRCGYYPTITQVPDQLTDNLVDLLVEIGREKLKLMAQMKEKISG